MQKMLYASKYAGMAELADALDSGSNGRKAVQVRPLLPAPKIDKFRQKLVDFTFSLLTLHFSLFSFETCRLGNK